MFFVFCTCCCYRIFGGPFVPPRWSPDGPRQLLVFFLSIFFVFFLFFHHFPSTYILLFFICFHMIVFPKTSDSIFNSFQNICSINLTWLLNYFWYFFDVGGCSLGASFFFSFFCCCFLCTFFFYHYIYIYISIADMSLYVLYMLLYSWSLPSVYNISVSTRSYTKLGGKYWKDDPKSISN